MKHMEEKRKNILKLGYTEEDIKKIQNLFGLVNKSTEIVFEKIEKIYNLFQELGYSQQEIKRITKHKPVIYGYSIENMKQKLEYMQSIGYSKEEAIVITKKFPSIFGLSKEKLNEKIEILQKMRT